MFVWSKFDLYLNYCAGTSKVMETESYRRDIEQREAVLRATSKQLQVGVICLMLLMYMLSCDLFTNVNEFERDGLDCLCFTFKITICLFVFLIPLLTLDFAVFPHRTVCSARCKSPLLGRRDSEKRCVIGL